MLFCRYLVEDCNFEPEALQPCCNIRALGVPRFPFSGGALDMQAYRRHIAETIRQLQTESSVCRGCPHLVETGDDSPLEVALRVRFKTVSLNQHRYYCNCKCVYCGLWAARKKAPPYPVLPALQSMAEQNALDEQCFFSWGGGEPSIVAEFEEASAWIMARDCIQYVHTNALRCSPAITELLRARRGGISVSLDAGTAKTYHAIKGVDAWATVLKHLAEYRAACFDPDQIEIKYIIFERNNAAGEVESFFQTCTRLGITNVHYSLNFNEVNTGRLSEKTLLTTAFFRQRARMLNMNCKPFFIDQPILQRIAALEQQHFPT